MFIILHVKKILSKIGLLGLLIVVLVACSNDDQNNNSEPAAATDETEGVAVNDEEAEPVSVGDSGEDLDVPSLIPSDFPFPSDSVRANALDSERDANINVITSMSADELEELYDDYFEDHPSSDLVDKHVDVEEEYTVVSYTIIENDTMFYVKVTDKVEGQKSVYASFNYLTEE